MNDQWKLEGDCSQCRRALYCSTKCKKCLERESSEKKHNLPKYLDIVRAKYGEKDKK